MLGIAALVATLGVSRTAGSQIVGRFDELAATQVVVKPAGADQPGAGNSSITSVIPWDAADRLARLNGVVAAATLSEVDLGGGLVRAVPVKDPTGQRELAMTVRSASPALLAALRGRLATGRPFDAGHSARADRVALLGRGAAERLVLGGVSLLVGAVGIANVTLVSVLERVGEIGLRRAMGAARRHIAVQFLAESLVLGLVGGVVGASLGTLVIVGISAARSWTPVLDSSLALAAPLVGGVVGLLAGVYPSLRAASLEPVEALRSGT